MRPSWIKAAVRLLHRGAVVGIPTDTVYGVAVDPHRPEAVARLYEIKGRAPDKPIGLLVAGVDDARTMVEVPGYAAAWLERHWPGPLNIVARSRFPLPSGVGDATRGTVGVRVPDHPVALELLRAFGPLAVTSANLAGGRETLDEVEAAAVLGDRVAFYVPGACPGTVASTTVDVSGPEPVLLRRGPLDLGLSP
ncbi:MAG TPA: L-threonylcarbamoyladenylate synthase [Acidimicrobiia bacterium]|nr:L-threonylcarbamoyladenylate synthase [Acidimicrobiia bacterium]